MKNSAKLFETDLSNREAQITDLFLKHRGYCYEIARQFLCHEDAQEVVQDVFLRMTRTNCPYSGRGGAKFSTWLYRVTMNVAKNKYRGNKSRASLSNPENPALSLSDGEVYVSVCERADGENTFERLVKREVCADTAVELTRLPDQYREAFVLRNVQELEYRQIAQILGCKLGTIKSRIFRARVMLKERVLNP